MWQPGVSIKLPVVMGGFANLRVVRDDEVAAPIALPLHPASRGLVRAPELAELRAFCAAVDLGSIGQAARLLGFSQPGLSKRLQGLEAVVGTQLLSRSTRGVTTTEAGTQLYAVARRLLVSAESVEAVMRGLSTHVGPVRVAASPTIADWWLPGALVDLESGPERHLSVEVITANSLIVREMVRDGSTDIGLAAVDPCDSDPEQFETVVWSDEVVIGVPTSHPWAACDEIDPYEFASTPIIRRDPGANSCRVMQAALQQFGLTAVPALAQIASNAAARATALAECAPVLLPNVEVRAEPSRGLVAKRVAGMRFERKFSLILATSMHELTASAQTFAQHLLTRNARKQSA
jgi:DNA-binding transcriptional LysR family regulator